MFTIACAGQQQAVMPANHFNPADYAGYSQKGNHYVRGEAFLPPEGQGVQQTHGLVNCAGATVNLLPGTPYVLEALAIARKGQVSAEPAVKKLLASGLYRTTTCDSEGKFSFEGLPEQDWVIDTKVVWLYDNGTGLGPAPFGAIMALDISTKGKNIKAILNQNAAVEAFRGNPFGTTDTKW